MIQHPLSNRQIGTGERARFRRGSRQAQLAGVIRQQNDCRALKHLGDVPYGNACDGIRAARRRKLPAHRV